MPYELVLTAAWLVGLYVVLALLRAFLIGGHERHVLHRRAGQVGWRGRVPRLLIDLLTLALLAVGSAIILSVVWGQDIGGLLAALGIGSIVIGLALQDTLGNLIAGLALLFEKPYRIGDWIRVDGVEGQVVEVNWRALRLRTRDHTGSVSSTVSSNSIETELMPTRLTLRISLISSMSRRLSSILAVTRLSTRSASAPGKRVLTSATLLRRTGSSIRGRIAKLDSPATRINNSTNAINRESS